MGHDRALAVLLRALGCPFPAAEVVSILANWYLANFYAATKNPALIVAAFRAGSLTAVWNIYEGLLILPQHRLEGRNVLILAMACALLPSSMDICRRLVAVPRLAVPAGLGVAMVALLVALGERQNYQFIYFQF